MNLKLIMPIILLMAVWLCFVVLIQAQDQPEWPTLAILSE